MAKRHVYFPRYLARQKLYFVKEVDEWLIIIGSLVGSFYLFAIFIGITVLVALPMGVAFTYYVNKFYLLYSKDASPGYLLHLLYDIGLYNPTKNKNDDDDDDDIDLPYGFERRFTD